MTRNEREARALRLKEWLRDEDVQAALQDVEADITAEWKQAKFSRSREARWNELRGLERLKTKLANYAGQAR